MGQVVLASVTTAPAACSVRAMTTSAACPRRLWPRILVVELGHAVGWILLFGVLAVGFLLAHLTIPALAEAQR